MVVGIPIGLHEADEPVSDILEKLREWHDARVGNYPLLWPAIEEITRLRKDIKDYQARNGELRMQVNDLQQELAAKWQTTWALRKGMDDMSQRVTRLEKTLQEEKALVPNVQTTQDGRVRPMEDKSAIRPEVVGGPKINWVP